MRVFNVQPSARPVPADRNPVNKAVGVNTGAIGPHAATVRWTYTVPTGKKAYYQYLYQWIRRVAAAAPVGDAWVQADYTPNGGSLQLIDTQFTLNNAANDFRDSRASQLGDLLVGDQVRGTTQDGSTGGTVSYVTAARIFEYDA